MIEVSPTPIENLLIIRPQVFADNRGYFFESYHQEDFLSKGLNYNFVQDNQSRSAYGTIRGLHWQKGPFEQTKLVRVLNGSILDVAVDLRKESKTYGMHFSVELTAENYLQLLVPRGFAHGFSVLSPEATVIYKCDSVYAPKYECGLHCFDPELSIDWKIPKDKAILSSKDSVLPGFREASYE